MKLSQDLKMPLQSYFLNGCLARPKPNKKRRLRASGDDVVEVPDDMELIEEEQVDDQVASESDAASEAEPPAAPIAKEKTTKAPVTFKLADLADSFTLVRLEAEHTNGSAEFRNLDFR